MRAQHGAAARRRRHLAALALYGVLSLLLTWPLARHLATHVAGDGIDDPALAWNLWWVKARWVDQLAPDLFGVDWMFHPININLAFYTLTPLNGLLSVPLQAAVGLVPAANLLLLGSFVLSGYGTFLLALALLGEGRSSGRSSAYWSALLAGVIYAFGSYRLFYAALGQANIVGSHWIPFAVLYLLRLRRSDGRVRREAGWAGLFLTLQAWVELTYGSFLLLFAAALAVWTTAPVLVRGLLGPRAVAARQELVRLVRPFVWVGLFFLAGIAPFLAAMAPDLAAEGDFFGSGGGFAESFSADLVGFLLPTQLHPWWGGWAAALPFPHDKGQHIFVGYSAMALGGLGAVRLLLRRETRGTGWFWLLLTLLFGWLMLGPTLHWNGQDLGIPGPFALVSKLPFFSGNRYPSRYSVMLMLCVALLAAYGVEGLGHRVRRLGVWAAAVGMGLLFMVEQLAVPLPLNNLTVPPIYDRLAALSPGGALLELPTGWRNGARVLGRSDVLIMMQQWYQTTHGRRRLGGNTSRNPAYKFQYFSDAPLIGDLIALMNADDPRLGDYLRSNWEELVRRDRALAPAVLDFLDVDFVMVHVERSPALLLRFVDEVLPLTLVDEWQGEDWEGRSTTMRLYRTQLPVADSVTIDLGGETGSLYLAEGWSAAAVDGRVRYATRAQAELLLDLPEGGSRLTIELFGPATQVELGVNGRELARVPLAAGRAVTATIDVPAGLAVLPVDRLTLHFGGPSVAPAAVTVAPTTGWSVGESGVRLVGDAALFVRSAGEEVGDFAEIRVRGQQTALSERGYNLVALQPDGTVLASAVFDTFATAEASRALSAWVAGWPAGTIVAGAVADEASRNLTEEAVAALRSLGVSTDLRGHFRWSHAFVGSSGAAGRAVEKTSLIETAWVAVGSPVNSETVTGGVGQIRIVAQNVTSP